MARTETGQLVTSNRPKIVRRHDHRVLHAIAVESLRGRRRDAPPMSVGLNVCCAPTRELRAQTAATLLSVEADALPDTTDRTSNREKSISACWSVVPAFFVAEFSSFLARTRSCEDQLESSTGIFFQSIENIPYDRLLTYV